MLAVSVFSGTGGLDLGMESAGFSTRLTVESEPYACEALRRNQARGPILPSGRRFLEDAEIVQRDIRRVSGVEILRRTGIRPRELGVLCGGPPCVTFSVAGRREGLASETGRLFEAYARLLRVLRPRAFVFENVKGMLTAVDEDNLAGGAWSAITRRLTEAGYRVSWRLVDAADYGVPQHRERVIVVGLRGLRGAYYEFPEPTHAPPGDVEPRGAIPWRTVRDAIGDLPPAAAARGEEPLPNHLSRRHSPEVQASFSETPPGHRNDRFKRDRLRWDRPSKVIRAQGKLKPDGSGQRNSSHQALHPDHPRQLTVRECGRIQTFPDWFEFPDTFANGYRLVGDAVPPALAAAIAAELARQAFGHCALDDAEGRLTA